MSRFSHRHLFRSVAVVLAVTLTATVATAWSASALTWARGHGTMAVGDAWYGSYRSGGELGYCGDPIAGGATFHAPTANGGSSYGAVRTATSWNPRTSGVGPLSASNVRRLAYVVAAHGHTASSTQAARVSYAIRRLVASPGGAHGTATPSPPGSSRAGGERLLTESSRHAGPYSIALQVEPAEDARTATVSSYRPVSAAGATMTGYAGTLTISGPAVFAANAARRTAAPGDGAPVAVRSTGDGRVTVTASYPKLPSARLHYREPSRKNFQRIIVSGRTEPVRAADTYRADVPNTPTVQTQTSHQVAAPGTSLTDRLEVSGLDARSSVDVVSTLYGPFASRPVESATPPAGAPSIGSVTTRVTADDRGAATATTSGLTIEGAGYYVWFETIAETPENRAWPGRFGQASETTLLRWSPQVTTQTSDQRVEPGAAITDRLSVRGLKPGSSARVESTLYGPFADRPRRAPAPPAKAPVAGTVSTDVTGDGGGAATAVTEPITVSVVGYYVWHETIAATDEQVRWRGVFGQTSETTQVVSTPPPSTPSTPPLPPAPPTPPDAAGLVPAPALPDTGAPTRPWVLLSGLALVATGALVLVVVGRQRRSRPRWVVQS